MSGSNRPKELLREAQEAEKVGQSRTASNLYATLAAHLRRHEKWIEAKVMIDKAIGLSKTSARLYLQKARIDVGLNDESSAKNAIKSFTQYTIEKKRVSEYTQYLEEQLKDYPLLRQQYYETLLEVDRTNGSSFLGLARTFCQQHKWEEAQAVLLDALKIREVKEAACFELFSVLKSRNLEEAGILLKKFQSGDLSHSDLVTLLSNNKGPKFKKEKSEKTEVSAHTFDKGLRTLIAELEEEMGLEVESKRDTITPLVKEFRRQADPIIAGDAKARIDMALAFFEMGLNKDAREELSPIVYGDPLYLEAQCLLGELMASEGSDLSALEVFQQCLRDERCKGSLANQCEYQLLQIYQRLGDIDRAFSYAKQLEKNAPGFRDVHQIYVQLQDALKGKKEELGRK